MAETKYTGVGVAGLLGVAFVVLKLCHVIDWSWWWVLSPFWIPLAILAVFLVVVLMIYLGILFMTRK